jgi:elongator complex protein 3
VAPVLFEVVFEVMLNESPRMTGPGKHRAVDVKAHRAPLRALVDGIIEAGLELGTAPVPAARMDDLLRRHPKAGRGFFSRGDLIAAFRYFDAEGEMPVAEARFVELVQRRPVRTQSGVTPLTVLTRPHPCPGKCIFCPNDVRMPKSYLSDEPGAQRAAVNRFDPYLQTWNRLAAYRAIGHPVDKVELIVLGGTWSFHPEPYQVWFVKRCFDALNDFGAGVDAREAVRLSIDDWEALPARVDGREHARNPYNRIVSGFLTERLSTGLVDVGEAADWQSLEAAHHRNETAGCRSVGLVLETRPDLVDASEVLRLRRLGATKVQLGLQSLDDAVLEANRRGHDVAAGRRAMALLRAAGFKLHAHWMANLKGATPERDVADFARLFEDAGFRPDELKLYPCSLIESAELMRDYEAGTWRPYDHDELLDVVASALAGVPRWCRVTRVIRDISSDDIVVGNKRTNFRQIAEAEVARRGGCCVDVRSREIGRDAFEADDAKLRVTEYATSTGTECFHEFVTPEDRILGFLRLSLPDGRVAAPAEIEGAAVIREVHVYGAAVGLGEDAPDRPQHRGLGTRLIEAAASRARRAGFARLAVISAVGTRGYYRGRGFADGRLYQFLDLQQSLDLQP